MRSLALELYSLIQLDSFVSLKKSFVIAAICALSKFPAFLGALLTVENNIVWKTEFTYRQLDGNLGVRGKILSIIKTK